MNIGNFFLTLNVVLILVLLVGQIAILKKGRTLAYQLSFTTTIVMVVALGFIPSNENHPYWIQFAYFSSILLIAILSYLSIKSYVSDEKSKHDLRHLAWVIPFFLQMLLFLFWQFSYENIAPYFMRIQAFLLLGLFYLYSIKQFTFVSRLRQSSRENKQFGYLWQYVVVFLVLHTSQFILSFSGIESEEKTIDLISNIIGTPLIALAVYLLLKASSVVRVMKQDQKDAQNTVNDEKVLKQERMFRRIDDLIKVEQLFLDPNFSAGVLSKRTSINSTYISQAINNQYGASFPRYINELRVNFFLNEVKKEEHKNWDLISVATKSGFSSKSSFNRVFKEVMGEPPSEYLKKHRIQW